MQHACINSVRASTRSAENCRLDAAAAIARDLSRSNGNETVQWRRKRGTRRPRCFSYLSSTRPDRVDTEHPSTPTFTIILTPLCRRSHLRDTCTPYIFAPGRLNDACVFEHRNWSVVSRQFEGCFGFELKMTEGMKYSEIYSSFLHVSI